MIQRALLVLILFLIPIQIYSTSLREKPTYKNSVKCVIALHGLARGPGSFKAMSQSLNRSGYKVILKGYPSNQKKIEELSSVVGDGLMDCEKFKATHIYFVTHSMGGILVRHYFQEKHSWFDDHKIKAIVMLSPPNQGSEIVDAFKNESWFQWLNGPAGQQLGTDPKSLPNTLKPIPFEIGIITGNVSSDPWFSYLFSGPHDGKVSVESAKLVEMKAFLVVPHGHTFIMNSKTVINQVRHFFEHRKFLKK